MTFNDGHEILLILSVLVHLFFSNLLLGGFPIMVITTWLGGWEGQGHLKDLAQKMRGLGPKVMGWAITLGFLVWLVIYSRYERHVMSMMNEFQIGYGLLLILLLMVLGGIYTFKTRNALTIKTPRIHVVIAGITIGCLLSMTFLFVVFHIITFNPNYSETVLQKGFQASLNLPSVWPRFFHIVLGSVAATGIVITLYGTLRIGQGKWHESVEDASINPFDHTTRYGVAWTLAGTLPQIVIGPWLLLTLPPEVRERLVDGASLSSVVFFVSLTFALLAIVLLNASLMVPHFRGLVWSGLGSLFLTIVLMVVVREEVRKAWMQSSDGAGTYQELSGGVVVGVTSTVVVGFLIIGRFQRL